MAARILLNLDGFGRIESIGGNLEIVEGIKFLNEELSDISGLRNLRVVRGDVIITNNPKLPTCAAEELLTRLEDLTGGSEIAGNDDSASCD
jgi:hypothetical protein